MMATAARVASNHISQLSPQTGIVDDNEMKVNAKRVSDVEKTLFTTNATNAGSSRRLVATCWYCRCGVE